MRKCKQKDYFIIYLGVRLFGTFQIGTLVLIAEGTIRATGMVAIVSVEKYLCVRNVPKSTNHTIFVQMACNDFQKKLQKKPK